MKSIVFVTLVYLTQDISSKNTKFPDGFKFGVASAAYQVEGGHETRGRTVFDHLLKLHPSKISDGSNADTACDSYNHLEEDIEMLTNLKVDFYRFSISWSRILPTGYSNRLNPAGIAYYNRLIDALISKNIEPVVTMFHFDLPQTFLDLGGWTNPVLADLFEDYAKILFENFGDRVKTWITFNVILWDCGDWNWDHVGNLSGIGEYCCAKTVLLAHAKAYHLYQRYKGENGKLGLTYDGRWYEPGSTNPEDVEAAERVREFHLGMFLNPIFGNGDFPKIVKERVGTLSKQQGFLRSRLPQLTPSEIDYIKGSFDFLGLNIYSSFLVKETKKDDPQTYSYEHDTGAEMYQDSRWQGALSPWLKVTPWGFRKVLKWIKNRYDNPPILITENGFSDGGELNDIKRIEYYKGYLGALLEAIYEDGVDVKGYTAWSLMDNFEWFAGYSEKFGLYSVDFDDPDRKRVPKSSAKWYKKLIASRQLDDVKIKGEL